MQYTHVYKYKCTCMYVEASNTLGFHVAFQKTFLVSCLKVGN